VIENKQITTVKKLQNDLFYMLTQKPRYSAAILTIFGDVINHAKFNVDWSGTLKMQEWKNQE